MYAKSVAPEPSSTGSYVVDLRSDTLSVPTPSMRAAMGTALVGDDVYEEDPTVKVLEQRSAELLGMEAALFVPSGTMGNLIAIMNHCNQRGTEIIAGDKSHTFLYEQGGPSQIAGAQMNIIQNKPDGTFCLQEVERKIRGYDLHEPVTSLIIVENTHNMCGGKVLPLAWLDDLVSLASSRKIPLHMDGARIFNAAAYLGVPPARIVRGFDSVNFCLSKGLSAPIGSVLVGSKAFIHQARRMRKVLGGAMRQVGTLAAAGLVSLDEVVPTLKHDHQRTRDIAQAIHDLNTKMFSVEMDKVQTNILLLEINSPPDSKLSPLTSSELAKRLATVDPQEVAQGCHTDGGEGIVLKVSSRDWHFVRMVLYNAITDEHVKWAITKLHYVMKELDGMYCM